MTDTSNDHLDAVAVIGMSGRFPGAENIEQFWDNLKAGKESITTFTNEELLAEGLSADQVNDPNYVKKRGLIDAPELFDAAFFGVSPREAELMDPQHRIFLETCWHAMEDAGYAPNKYENPVGVWGGMSTGMRNNTYLLSNLHAPGQSLDDEDVLPAMLGNENDYLTTRVSYKLNLGGPSINVQTACSTSLVAITNAFQSLMTYGCDMALAGGVSVSYPQKEGYLFQEGDIGSPDGHCRPFDAKAQGTVFSNGVGVVVLKRLEDALADGDTVYAVVRGAAINNDGSSKVSFAAPSVDGQANAIATAQAIADVEPETVSFVECHGTGTPIGDPIEINGLKKAFGDTEADEGTCALGSVKSNFGHLDSAAGVAAFIKTVLCLHHKTLVPTLHFETPHPNIRLENSPFYINTECKAWESEHLPRRAGVSGFGIGGTNAHVVIEEFVEEPRVDEANSAPELLIFSAKTKAALAATLDNFSTGDGSWKQHRLRDIAHTLREGREEFMHRAMVSGRSLPDMLTRIASKDACCFATGKKSSSPGNAVFLFPGGGAQYVHMAKDLYHSIPLVRRLVDEGIALLRDRHQIDLRPIWFAEPDSEEAKKEFLRPSLQLPALFILEVAVSRWWVQQGVVPDALLGHSMGENAAACVAGVISFEDGLGLVALRGKLFEQVPEGGMLSVSASIDKVRPLLDDQHDVATVNSPETCTISGTTEALERLAKSLANNDIECQQVPIRIAAHSQLLDSILGDFKAYLESIDLSAPSIPIVSNYTGTWLTDEQAMSPAYWVNHLRHTVLFSECVNTLLAEDRFYIEVGPGKILGSLVKLHAPTLSGQVMASVRHVSETADDEEYLYAAMGKLWCAGYAVPWRDTCLAQNDVKRVSLPGYAFQRKPYLISPPPPNALATMAPITSGMHQNNTLQEETYSAHLEPGATEMTAEGVTPVSRKQYIESRLVDTIEKMSGLDREDIELDMTFLDMGFDSLFLTQANLKFKKEFGVKITFRQLFEDAPSIAALAAFIDGALPPDALSEELAAQTEKAQPMAPAPQAAVPQLAASSAAAPGMPAVSGDLAQLLTAQLQASNAILQYLAGGQSPAPAVAHSGLPSALPAAAPQSNRAPAPKQKVEAKGFGPYRPVETKKGELSDTAREALKAFAEAYSARTAGSKALANTQRKHLSDARSISGFRVDWKEMVYQIAGAGSKGTRIWDVDGNEYLDVTSGFGCNLLGYAIDEVKEAVKQQVDQGFELGTLSPLAKEAAEVIHDLTGMDRVTFTNTGSEALSAAVRAARAITGKERIAVFYDEYHGIADELLVNIRRNKDGSTSTVPTSPGIPQFLVDNVLVLEWDDPDYMQKLRDNADDLAALIIEPVQNRNPALQTHHDFAAIRALTKDENIALIFDEMITGFRLHPGGAQAYFDVEADMCCYGKIVSAGMPLAVLAGRGEWLDCFDGGPWQFGDDSFPEAGVIFFGGTYTRHPLSLAGTLAGLKKIQQLPLDAYTALNARCDRLALELNTFMLSRGYPARFENRASIFNLKFNDDNAFSRLIFWQLRHRGILIYDRPFFISMLHTDEEFEQFKRAVEESVIALQESRIVPPVTMDGFSGGSQFVPFSASQQEIWFASQMGKEAASAYHEQVIYALDQAPDMAALRCAVQKLVYKHEALRATANEERLGLDIHPAMHVPVAYKDLTEHPDPDQAFQDFCAQHIHDDFNLFEGPLLRCSVVRTGAERYAFLMAGHHLVIDGWSMGIMLDELASYYGKALKGERFGEPAINQLSGVNIMLEKELAGEEAQESEAFWLAQYQETPPVPPALPLDFQRPAVKTYHGKRLVSELSPEIVAQIKAVNQKHRCTMFTFMLSAFSVWLHKLTHQNDLVIGVPVAGQALWGCSDLVGHLVSYLPFRLHMDAHSSFSGHLDYVKNYTLEANENQKFTYGNLLKKLALPRDPSQSPLTSVSFNVDQGMAEFDFGGLRASYLPCPRHYVKYDLFFNVIDEDARILIELDFNSDLFTEQSVQAWLALFEEHIQSMLKDEARLVSDFNALRSAETSTQTSQASQRVPAKTAVMPEVSAYSEQVLEIWRNVLLCDQVKPEDDFFALGGHSLLAVSVVNELSNVLQVTIPVRVLFENPVFADFCLAIEQWKQKNTDAMATLTPVEALPDPVERPADVSALPLNSGQRRLWYLSELEPEIAAYNIPLVHYVRGTLDTGVLEQALEHVIGRHESLRTRLVVEDGLPYQHIGATSDTALRKTDLSTLSETDQQRQLQELIREDAAKSFKYDDPVLWRGHLIRLSEQTHVLSFVFYHMIFDGESGETFLEELAECYAGLKDDRPINLAPVPLQQADHALWQQQLLESERMQQQLAYWKSQLDGALPTLDLPLDFPRPPVQSFAGASVRASLNPEQVDALRQLGAQHEASLFMVLLATYVTLLYRYSGEEDIIVGLPVSGRHHHAFKSTVGYLTNTLALRIQPNVERFSDLLASVKSISVDAMANADVPFAMLVEELNPARDMSRTPVYQTLFSYLATDNQQTFLGEAGLETVHPEDSFAQTDLSLWLQESQGGVDIALNYCSDLFEAETAQALVDAFIALTYAIINNAEADVKALSLCSTKNEPEKLSRVMGPALEKSVSDHAGNDDLVSVFERTALQYGEREALVCGEQRLSHTELHTRSNQWANYLVEQGAVPGAVVGLCLERSVDMVVALLALIKTGACYVPIDPAFPQERIRHIIADSGLQLMVTQESLAANLPDVAQHVFTENLSALSAEQPKAFNAATSDSAAPAYIIYTSGSTGKPKGVKVPRSAVANFLGAMASKPGLTHGDCLLAVTTLSFDISVLELLLPLWVGAKTVIAQQHDVLDGRILLDLISRQQVNVMQATPATWRLLIDAGWKGDDAFKALIGGEALPVDLAKELIDRTGELWNMYGPTETTVWSSCARIDALQSAANLGDPIANTQLYVVDAKGQLLPQTFAGELCIGGAGVAIGYHNLEALTAERFVKSEGEISGRIYKTGDRVRMRRNGRLDYLGRFDQQVKIRGFRIELGEIESALRALEEVVDCAVAVREVRAGDVRLVAFVVWQDQPLTMTDIRKKLANILPAYMVPQHLQSLDALPRTANNKLDRKALQHLVMEGVREKRVVEPLGSDTEKWLADIWQSYTGTASIGRFDNFFEIGGHSLLSMQVIHHVASEKGVIFTPRDMLLENLAQLASKINEASHTEVQSSTTTEESAASDRKSEKGLLKTLGRILKND